MARKGRPKFYAVRVGRKPGVYTTWAEVEALVTSFSGAVHKSFPTREEANRWLNAGRSPSNTTASQQVNPHQGFQRGSDHSAPPGYHHHPIYQPSCKDGFDLTRPQGGYPVQNSRHDPTPLTPAPATRYPIVNTVSSRVVFPPGTPEYASPPLRRQPSQTFQPQQPPIRLGSTPTTTAAPPAKRARPDSGAAEASSSAFQRATAAANADNELAVVYTDGAAPGNGKFGATAGVGVYFGEDDPRNISCRLPGPLQTNQRAELTAILYALWGFLPTASVEIRTDSQYSIDCVTNWYVGWARNGWRSSKGAPVKNDDIIKPIRALIDERDAVGARTKFTKVTGHSGDPGNDQADLLAVAGAQLPAVRD